MAWVKLGSLSAGDGVVINSGVISLDTDITVSSVTVPSSIPGGSFDAVVQESAAGTITLSSGSFLELNSTLGVKLSCNLTDSAGSNGLSHANLKSAYDNTVKSGLLNRLAGVIIDGGGSAITAGTEAYFYIPGPCALTKFIVMGDVTGSAVVDVDYAVPGETLTWVSVDQSSPVVLSGEKHAEITSVTEGWIYTFQIEPVYIIRVTVTSVTSFTKLDCIAVLTQYNV